MTTGMLCIHAEVPFQSVQYTQNPFNGLQRNSFIQRILEIRSRLSIIVVSLSLFESQ